jgi:penicillin-binding protein 2
VSTWRIERAISKQSIVAVGGFFLLIVIVFSFRLGVLQIKKGNSYLELSKKNSLDSQIIFANRGVIFDRNGIELAWNERTPEMTEFDYSHRAYIGTPGNGLLLGYIKYPQKDKAGFYWQKTFIGMDGIEESLDTELNGTNGSKIIETSAYGDVSSENIINQPTNREKLKTHHYCKFPPRFP